MSYRLMRTGVGVLVVVAALLVAPTVGADLKVTGSVAGQRVGFGADSLVLATADTPFNHPPEQLSLEDGVRDLMQAGAGEGRVQLSRSVDRELFHLTTPASLPIRKETRRASGPFGITAPAGTDTTREHVIGPVDVAIVSLPNDLGSGRVQTAADPRVLRTLNTTQDVYSLLHPLEVLSVVDYGDFVVTGRGTQQATDEVATMVQEKANSGAVPMLVSGERSMLYPGVTGVARAHKEEIGLLSFSARTDLGGSKRFTR